MLIIYDADTPQHEDVIRQLTRLLQTQCNFNVVSEMTRHEDIRHSKNDFVLNSFNDADVVLVVVSEDLRAPWLAQPHDNMSTRDCCLMSVGELLLRQLRSEVVLRPRRVKRMAARFDYTPAMTDVDARLAFVPEVYELMRDVDVLLLRLRGVKRSTQLLTLACCLWFAHDNHNLVETTQLQESVAVARQHYQQPQQMALTSDEVELAADSEHAAAEQTTKLLIVAPPYVNDVLVDNLPSDPTSGYVSVPTGELQAAGGGGCVVASTSELSVHAVDGGSTADSDAPRRTERQRSTSSSFESMCWRRVSQMNDEYDLH